VLEQSPLQTTRRGAVAAGLAALAAPAFANSVSIDGFGRAKRCVLIYLWGSPSQLETFDPKPDAPVEIRGEFGSIASNLPSVRVGEILPRTARWIDRCAILRSLTHEFPIHGTAFATTSVPATDLQLEGVIRDPRHWPYIGSVVDYVAEQDGEPIGDIPRNFGLPFQIGSKRRVKPGPFGGYLGSTYDPVWSEFRALGTRSVLRDAGAPDVPTKVIADPYLGILPTDRFETVAAQDSLARDEWSARLGLLDRLERPDAASKGSFARHRQMARRVLTSGKLRTALDVQSEQAAVRERYGMTLFGQSCLAARRVLEAGGKFVTVCWDEYGLVNTGWDTHVHMRSRMRDELGPGFDAAFSSLLQDLHDRGLLEDTAIAVISEHGRTPKVQNVAEGGRDHWSRAYSALFAGGGFAQGKVVGRTDAVAGEVVDAPCSPKDVMATLLHLLGIDPHRTVVDLMGRPHPAGGEGRVLADLLA
jgi:hypothetical protein